jgi:hypothetical protein
MQKTFRLLLLAAAIILGASWFAHWSKIRALNSGEVHVRLEPQETPAKPASPQPDAATTPPQEVASSEYPSANALPSNQQDTITALPASESLPRTPHNGIVAAGPGKFQLYRQGDLTFRLNTESGQACILFATDAQWRKPTVYDHGCGSH